MQTTLQATKRDHTFMRLNEHNHRSYLGLLLAMVNLLYYLMLSFSSQSTHTHQLACQQGHILNDGQPDPPFGIFSQLHYGRKE